MTNRKYKIAWVGYPNSCLSTALWNVSSLAWPQLAHKDWFCSQGRCCVPKLQFEIADISNYTVKEPE